MPFTKRTLLVWREAAKIKFHEKTGEYHLEHFTVEFPKPIQKGMPPILDALASKLFSKTSPETSPEPPKRVQKRVQLDTI